MSLFPSFSGPARHWQDSHIGHHHIPAGQAARYKLMSQYNESQTKKYFPKFWKIPQMRPLNFVTFFTCCSIFLPKAKPTGHRMVRVVVGGDYFEVMTSLSLLHLATLSPTPNFFGVWSGTIHQKSGSIGHWQFSLRGGICCSLIRFLFGVGSLAYKLNEKEKNT